MDQQQWFRSGRGTSDGIYITKRIQQITDSIEKPVFVDLSSAFDHVTREWLFKSISQRAMPNKPTKLFNILKAIYSFTTTALSETPNDSFKILTGLRQGGPESPLLYNLYMDYVLRIQRNECHTRKINLIILTWIILTWNTVYSNHPWRENERLSR